MIFLVYFLKLPFIQISQQWRQLSSEKQDNGRPLCRSNHHPHYHFQYNPGEKRLPPLTGNFDNQNKSCSNCNAMQWWNKQKLWMQFSKRLTLMKLQGKERFSLEKSNVIFDKWNQPCSQPVSYSCDASKNWRCNILRELCCTFRVEHHGWPCWPVSVSSAKCNIRPKIWITSSTLVHMQVAWIFSFLQVAWIFSFFASCLNRQCVPRDFISQPTGWGGGVD